MKTALLFCVLMLALNSGSALADNKAELQTVLATFLDGATRNDAQVHNNFWAEELIYTSSRGRRFGKAELMQGVNERGLLATSQIDTQYSSEDVRVMQYGDIAVLAFVLVATTDNSVQRYLNSGTLLKRNGRWQAVNWQATEMAP